MPICEESPKVQFTSIIHNILQVDVKYVKILSIHQKVDSDKENPRSCKVSYLLSR